MRTSTFSKFPSPNRHPTSFILLSFLWGLFCWSAQGQDLPQGVLVKIQGDVRINGRQAQKGDPLVTGDVLEALGPQSKADIKLLRGEKIRLVHGQLTFSRLASQETLLQLLKGTIYSHVRKLLPGQKFFIKTKTASIGVRGTKFMVEESADKSYLCVCEGIVESIIPQPMGKGQISPQELNYLVKEGEDQWIDPQRKTGPPTKSSPGMMSMVKDVFADMDQD